MLTLRLAHGTEMLLLLLQVLQMWLAHARPWWKPRRCLLSLLMMPWLRLCLLKGAC
jgi:hypothetical protein